MNRKKKIVTPTSRELAGALGLTPVDGEEIELRSHLNTKIVEEVKRRG